MGCRSVGELQQWAVDQWVTVTAVGCRSVGELQQWVVDQWVSYSSGL